MIDNLPLAYVYVWEVRVCPACGFHMLMCRGQAPIGSERWICGSCRRAWDVPLTKVEATEVPYPPFLDQNESVPS